MRKENTLRETGTLLSTQKCTMMGITEGEKRGKRTEKSTK